MVRIVHFSDIHFGRPSLTPSSLFDKRLLGTFNYLFRRKGDVDETALPRLLEHLDDLHPQLIVCSGDITCVGSPEEFAAATEALLPFTRFPGAQFLYVPGNHDAYVPRKTCRDALQETCATLNPPGCTPVGHPFHSIDVQDISVGLLNLAHPTNIFLSCGTLSPKGVDSLSSWCKQLKERECPGVLIGHFPTQKGDGTPLGFRRHLRGGKYIADLLDEGQISLYLCGHIHSPFTRTPLAGGLECCAGSLTMKSIFSVIDIEPGGNVKHRHVKL